MILGVDAGNSTVKACGPAGVDMFSSCIGPYRDRRLEQRHGDDDMIVEYQGQRWFAGSLARWESDWGHTRKGDTKAHEEARLRFLIACHRAGGDEYRLIVGQPISRHTPEEKQRIKEMLEGRHEIAVNGIRRAFVIRRVEVAAEGAAANLADPRAGLVRIIDAGSGTVNLATIVDRRYIDRESWTVRRGMETVADPNPETIARGIANIALDRWSPEDTVRIVGGAAEMLLPHIRAYFPNADVLRPRFRGSNGVQVLDPVYANAVGFYEIGRVVYGRT